MEFSTSDTIHLRKVYIKRNLFTNKMAYGLLWYKSNFSSSVFFLTDTMIVPESSERNCNSIKDLFEYDEKYCYRFTLKEIREYFKPSSEYSIDDFFMLNRFDLINLLSIEYASHRCIIDKQNCKIINRYGKDEDIFSLKIVKSLEAGNTIDINNINEKSKETLCKLSLKSLVEKEKLFAQSYPHLYSKIISPGVKKLNWPEIGQYFWEIVLLNI